MATDLSLLAPSDSAARSRPEGADAVWYPHGTLTLSGKPVRILLPGGEATGFVKIGTRATAGSPQGSRGAPERTWSVLRDSGAADALGFEPWAWRPLPDQPWPHDLPEPITAWSAGARMVDVRPRKLAAMARQAAESARVQAELAQQYGPLEVAPGDSPAGSRPPGAKPGAQWWLDPVSVTYSAPGEIDILEAEARVARAILTDGLRSMERPAGLAPVAAGLAGLVAQTVSSDDAERRPRFEATARDHADYLTAFGWFAAIAPIELRPRWAGNDWLSGAQRVLVWQALIPPLSWRQIARRAGGSQEGWRKTWGGALAAVHRVANGGQPMTHVAVRDQLAALRERNMAWKRRVREPVAEVEQALGAMALGGQQGDGA